MVLAAVEAVCWSYVLPAFQGPDEASHFAYTQRMVERGELPQDPDPAAKKFSRVVDLASRWGGLAPLIANPQARPSWTQLEADTYSELEAELPDGARTDGTGPNSARNNPPLYYAWGSVPYLAGYPTTLFTRLELMRLANIPLFLAVVVLTWLLTAELLPRPPWARAVAAAVVTLHPEVAHFAGTYGPDMMLAAIWSGALYAFVLLVRRGPQLPLLAATVFLTAASLLTHPRGIPLVVPAAAAILISMVRHRPAVRRALPQLGVLAVIAAIPLAAYLLSIAGEPVVSGSAATSSTEHSFNFLEFGSYVWQFYLPQMWWMDMTVLGQEFGADRAFIQFFYGAFAWQEVLFAPAVYDWLLGLTLAGLAGLIVAAIVRRAELARHLPTLAVLLLTVVTLIGAVHYSEYRELLNPSGAPQIVGRYLVPLISLFGVAIAFTLSSLPRRAAPIAVALLVALGVLLQVAGLGLTFVRFYA